MNASQVTLLFLALLCGLLLGQLLLDHRVKPHAEFCHFVTRNLPLERPFDVRLCETLYFRFAEQRGLWDK